MTTYNSIAVGIAAIGAIIISLTILVIPFLIPYYLTHNTVLSIIFCIVVNVAIVFLIQSFDSH